MTVDGSQLFGVSGQGTEHVVSAHARGLRKSKGRERKASDCGAEGGKLFGMFDVVHEPLAALLLVEIDSAILV